MDGAGGIGGEGRAGTGALCRGGRVGISICLCVRTSRGVLGCILFLVRLADRGGSRRLIRILRARQCLMG